MELHLVYDRDTNGLLYTEFGPEREHNELAICCMQSYWSLRKSADLNI